MKIIAFIKAHQADLIRKILEDCGLWQDPPPPHRTPAGSVELRFGPRDHSRARRRLSGHLRRAELDQPELPQELLTRAKHATFDLAAGGINEYTCAHVGRGRCTDFRRGGMTLQSRPKVSDRPRKQEQWRANTSRQATPSPGPAPPLPEQSNFLSVTIGLRDDLHNHR